MKVKVFEEIIRKVVREEIDYALMLVIGRAVHPSSERECVRWILNDSALEELLKTKVKLGFMVIMKSMTL